MQRRNDVKKLSTRLESASVLLGRGASIAVGVATNAESFPTSATGLAGLFGEILDEFMREEFLPNAVLPEFDRGRDRFRTHEAHNVAIEDRGNMQAGLTALRERLMKASGPRISGRQVRVGLGEGVGDMPLSKYTEFRPGQATRSPYNSFFWAVEMGTGEFARADYRRREGQFKESDGSWWRGLRRGVGVHFRGTKGMHFLADRRSRMPKMYYYDFISRSLPRFAARAIRTRFSR